MKQFINIATVFLVLFIFCLTSPKQAFANLLLNSSFEEASSSAPLSWAKNVSTATLGISATAKTGTVSASINKTNGSTGLIYLYQDVDIESGSYYSLSGNAIKNSSKFGWVILRISWRDLGGSEISKTDSSQITTDSSNFQFLKIDSVQAPSQVIRARIELAGNITTANPENPVLFDDVDFSQIATPDQPTSTPTPTSTNTPTPTPTKTPTAIPVTLTMASDSAEILGESTDSALIFEGAVTQVPERAQLSKETKVLGENNFAKFMISLGLIFIAACGILAFRSYRRGKNEIKNL